MTSAVRSAVNKPLLTVSSFLLIICTKSLPTPYKFLLSILEAKIRCTVYVARQ